MRSNGRTELYLLFVGGLLLVLHAIAVCVRVVASFATAHLPAAHGAAYLTGEVATAACFLLVGVGLLGLAWTKRGNRGVAVGSDA